MNGLHDFMEHHWFSKPAAALWQQLAKQFKGQHKGYARSAKERGCIVDHQITDMIRHQPLHRSLIQYERLDAKWTIPCMPALRDAGWVQCDHEDLSCLRPEALACLHYLAQAGYQPRQAQVPVQSLTLGISTCLDQVWWHPKKCHWLVVELKVDFIGRSDTEFRTSYQHMRDEFHGIPDSLHHRTQIQLGVGVWLLRQRYRDTHGVVLRIHGKKVSHYPLESWVLPRLIRYNSKRIPVSLVTKKRVSILSRIGHISPPKHPHGMSSSVEEEKIADSAEGGAGAAREVTASEEADQQNASAIRTPPRSKRKAAERDKGNEPTKTRGPTKRGRVAPLQSAALDQGQADSNAAAAAAAISDAIPPSISVVKSSPAVPAPSSKSMSGSKRAQKPAHATHSLLEQSRERGQHSQDAPTALSASSTASPSGSASAPASVSSLQQPPPPHAAQSASDQILLEMLLDDPGDRRISDHKTMVPESNGNENEDKAHSRKDLPAFPFSLAADKPPLQQIPSLKSSNESPTAIEHDLRVRVIQDFIEKSRKFHKTGIISKSSFLRELRTQVKITLDLIEDISSIIDYMKAGTFQDCLFDCISRMRQHLRAASLQEDVALESELRNIETRISIREKPFRPQSKRPLIINRAPKKEMPWDEA